MFIFCDLLGKSRFLQHFNYIPIYVVADETSSSLDFQKLFVPWLGLWSGTYLRLAPLCNAVQWAT